jgi:hypothetical protein
LLIIAIKLIKAIDINTNNIIILKEIAIKFNSFKYLESKFKDHAINVIIKYSQKNIFYKKEEFLNTVFMFIYLEKIMTTPQIQSLISFFEFNNRLYTI